MVSFAMRAERNKDRLGSLLFHITKRKIFQLLGEFKDGFSFQLLTPSWNQTALRTAGWLCEADVQVPPTRDQLSLKPQKIGSARKKLWYVDQNVNLLILGSLVPKKEVHI